MKIDSFLGLNWKNNYIFGVLEAPKVDLKFMIERNGIIGSFFFFDNSLGNVKYPRATLLLFLFFFYRYL